jgi:hypothetical protein
MFVQKLLYVFFPMLGVVLIFWSKGCAICWRGRLVLLGPFQHEIGWMSRSGCYE